MKKETENKKVVITGQKVLRIIAILSVMAVVVTAIIDIARGTPILEVFTDRPLIWVGALLPAFVIFFVLNNEKKDNESEKPEDNE